MKNKIIPNREVLLDEYVRRLVKCHKEVEKVYNPKYENTYKILKGTGFLHRLEYGSISVNSVKKILSEMDPEFRNLFAVATKDVLLFRNEVTDSRNILYFTKEEVKTLFYKKYYM